MPTLHYDGKVYHLLSTGKAGLPERSYPVTVDEVLIPGTEKVDDLLKDLACSSKETDKPMTVKQIKKYLSEKPGEHAISFQWKE